MKKNGKKVSKSRKVVRPSTFVPKPQREGAPWPVIAALHETRFDDEQPTDATLRKMGVNNLAMLQQYRRLASQELGLALPTPELEDMGMG